MIDESKAGLNLAAYHYRECNEELRNVQRDFSKAGKLFTIMAELVTQMGTVRDSLAETHQKNSDRTNTIEAHLAESLSLARTLGGFLGSRLEYEIGEASGGNQLVQKASESSKEVLALHSENELLALAQGMAEAQGVLEHGVQYCWEMRQHFNTAADSCAQQAQNL